MTTNKWRDVLFGATITNLAGVMWFAWVGDIGRATLYSVFAVILILCQRGEGA